MSDKDKKKSVSIKYILGFLCQDLFVIFALASSIIFAWNTFLGFNFYILVFWFRISNLYLNV